MDDRLPNASFLSLPPELRNQIYHLIYVPQVYSPTVAQKPLKPLELTSFGKDTSYDDVSTTNNNNASLLRVCRQIYQEAHLLYYDTTLFHLTGNYSDPKTFESIISPVPKPTQRAIKHIVLTAKLNHLRRLNEQWNSVPFGDDSIYLDTLTIVPKKPETHGSAYTEVADLSQSHTVAYILTETLKTLRNVRVVALRNDGCFSPVVWKLLYCRLVYRLWMWGGRLCGLAFRELPGGDGFEILCGDAYDKLKFGDRELEETDLGWREIGEEMNRLIGGNGMNGPSQPAWNVA